MHMLLVNMVIIMMFSETFPIISNIEIGISLSVLTTIICFKSELGLLDNNEFNDLRIIIRLGKILSYR